MTTGQLLWAGLFCCIVALAIQLFPAATYALGVDLGASWRLFGFGVFLISVATLLAASGGRRDRVD